MNLFHPTQVRPPRLARKFIAVTPWLAYAAIAAAMLKWTWLGWADPIVDFGVEIYSAWQISAGAQLYRDIAYHFGPLSAYWNGLWFAIFGPSYHLLFLLNFLAAGTVFFLLHRILSAMARPFAVFAALAAFLLLFLCPQYVGIGNENFMAPYRHGLTHGFLCSLAALWLAYRWMQNGRVQEATGVGFLLGLACLAKPEVAIPGFGATTTVFLAQIWSQHRVSRRDMLAFLAAAFGVALPILAMWLFLSAHMSHLAAWDGIVRPWRDVAASMPMPLSYQQWVMGVDQPLHNSIRMWKWFIFYAACFSVPIATGKWLAHKSAVIISGLLGVGLIWAAHHASFPWQEFASPLPLIMAVCIGLFTRSLSRQKNRKTVLRLAFSVFALLTLMKMILNVQIYHYGFVLALPATLCGIVLMLDWMPAYFKQNKAGIQLVALALLGVIGSYHLIRMVPFQKAKSIWVGHGGDLICMNTYRGPAVAQFLQKADGYIPPGATLAVMPEGATLNYLLRLKNSTPFTSLDPNTITLEQELRMLAAYQNDPPDFIALAHNDYSVFNLRFFGQDYAQSFRSWIEKNYRPVLLLGNTYPFQGDESSILLLQRQPIESQSRSLPEANSR